MKAKSKIALLRSSSKSFEARLSIHPSHFDSIDDKIKSFLYAENGYSTNLGYPDSFYCDKIKFEDRSSLISSSDCCLIVRPTPSDLASVKNGATLVGWFHCVQNQTITKLAVDKKLTLICMEGLFTENGRYFFEENSRITGRQAVNYTLNITNKIDDIKQKILVIGHGSAGVAAIEQFKRLGFNNITCLSKRNKKEIANPIDTVEYLHIMNDYNNQSVTTSDGLPILEILRRHHVIVNATTQDIHSPVFFLKSSDLPYLQPGTLIIDISCDDKIMSFDFAAITNFKTPVIQYDTISYCAIDHFPTLEYDNATKEISNSIVKILPNIIDYMENGTSCKILEAAIQIKNGVIINEEISYYRDRYK